MSLVTEFVGRAREFLLDGWTSALGHKPELDSQQWGAMVATWTGEEHHRRLTAYRLLEALFRNRGREFADLTNPADREGIREYGDAALLVHIVRSAVVGDRVSIAVEMGDDDAPDAAALLRQADFDAWATAEGFVPKLVETERDAVKLGDGVYALTTSAEKSRVRLRLFSPECYFPVRDPNDAEDDFPRTVRLAWQFTDRIDADTGVDRVRCITWRLGVREGGSRALPWNDRPSALTCYLSDGTWDLADIIRSRRNVDDGFLPGEATWSTVVRADGTELALEDYDLDLDFIPVVHLPNTVEVKAGWGEALLTGLVQIVEDLARADTNASSAADLASVPMIGYSGTEGAGDLVVRAGTTIDLGADGKLSTIDLSAALIAVMGYRDSLRERLSSNSRLPAEVLGMVKASDIASGILMALSFGPLRSLIEEMRLVRLELKYPLLLKMVQRMSIKAGFWTGDVLPANVSFGSYLPSDSGAVIDTVTRLYSAHLISRRTAIERLAGEGIVDVDVAAELAACESEDFAAALALLNATEGADLSAVYDLLHRTKPEGLVDPALAPTIPAAAPLPA